MKTPTTFLLSPSLLLLLAFLFAGPSARAGILDPVVQNNSGGGTAYQGRIRTDGSLVAAASFGDTSSPVVNTVPFTGFPGANPSDTNWSTSGTGPATADLDGSPGIDSLFFHEVWNPSPNDVTLTWTGLDPAKVYLIQVLHGEPRDSFAGTFTENTFHSDVDAPVIVPSFTLGNNVADENPPATEDVALVRTEVYGVTIVTYTMRAAPSRGASISGFQIRKIGTIVTTTADAGPGSLRQAISFAAPATTITFDPILSGQTITLTGGELVIDKELILDGSSFAGTGVTLSGNNASRIFRVTASGDLTLDSLTLFNGKAPAGSDAVAGPIGADATPGEHGGAIHNEGYLTILSCTLRDNTAGKGGDGVFESSPNPPSHILGEIGGNGGAIFSSGTLTVTNSTLHNNQGGPGGASADYSTGILGFGFAGGNGGAISSTGTLSISNSTITGNSAGFGGSGSAGPGDPGDGGGIDDVSIEWLANTIVAENSATHGPDILGNAGSIGGVNFVGDDSDATGLGTNGVEYLTGDPRLAALAYYGGPTETRPPALSSPAVDSSFAVTGSPADDQRGVARPKGSSPDIGAVELEPAVDLVRTVTNNNDSGAGSLRDTVAAAISGSTISFDASLSGQSITLTGGELVIDKELILDGSSFAETGVTLSGNNASRIFRVTATGDLTLDSLTLTGGRTPDGSDALAGNPGANATPSEDGGAIYNEGMLAILRCTLHDNATGNGGDGVSEFVPNNLYHIVGEHAGDGGAIFSSGTLTIENSTLHNNQTGSGGESKLYSNGTEAIGGNAGHGGAVFATDSLSISNSTITGNTCGTGGPGTAGPGTDGAGGGINGSEFTLTDTIVAENSATTGPDISGTATTASGVNFIGDATDATVPGTVLTGDPQLAVLGDYGGPTHTRPPTLGSPVLDASTSLDPGGTDQRGSTRFLNGTLDIGAVEFNGAAQIVSPADGETAISLNPEVAWSQPTDGSPTSYEIFVDDASWGTTTGTSLILLGLSRNTIYTLRIDANYAGTVVAGPETTFTTRASTIVDSTADPGVAGDGLTTLRQAIADAVPGDTITFDPGLDGQTITLTSGQLTIDKDLTIDASTLSNGLTIDANGASRVLSITSGGHTVVLDSLTITGGNKNIGGGVFAKNSTVTIANSTFTGNHATDAGGGIFTLAELNLENTSLIGNSASNKGGGLFVNNGSTSLRHGTVSGNSSSEGGGVYVEHGTFFVENSIVAQNTASTGADLSNYATVTPVGVNLIGDNDTVDTEFPEGPFAGTATSLLDPLLAPLGDYGGPTLTHAPLPGSPAIDAAEATALTTDQRGLSRPQGTAPDIGAVEIERLTVLNANDSGEGSLRQAIADASEFGVIDFDPSLAGATINTSGQLFIDKSLVVDASGLASPVTVDAGGSDRVLEVFPNGGHTVHLRSLALTGGVSLYRAGCLRNGRGANLTLTNVSIYGNHSNDDGGAIFNDEATLVLDGCTLSGNSANDNAGGIYNEGTAGNPATLTITNSTLANNTAPSGDGGGISNDGSFGPTELTLTHSTLVENVSSNGGGIHNVSGGLLVLENTIIANNTASTGPDLSGGATATTGVNLVGNTSGASGLGTPGIHYLQGDPLLAPLGSYGGPTLTHAPLPGSPAIDAAGAGGPATDQRGYPRPNGPLPDIGAVEAYPLTGLASTDGDTIPDLLEGPGTPYPHLNPFADNSAVDGDGSTDAEEIANMTNLYDRNDYFRILSFTKAAGFDPVTNPVFDVTISTFPGLYYQFEHQSDPSLPFDNLAPATPATDSTSTFEIELDPGKDLLRAKRVEPPTS